mmetsp:Transcript_49633/g.160440  ORF Transcript_49633/g.160440 Transcript_49633/m.160440 type:complete len:186 (-) Transcript_49633:82-639(-)
MPSLHERIVDVVRYYNGGVLLDSGIGTEQSRSLVHELEVDPSPLDASSLTELLEEKRRLLCRVSATLGAQVVDDVLGGGYGRQHGSFAGGPQQVVRTQAPAAAGHLAAGPPLPSFEPPARDGRAAAVVSEVEGEGTSEPVDLHSLCLSLRDGIERKRALLGQLQKFQLSSDEDSCRDGSTSHLPG